MTSGKWWHCTIQVFRIVTHKLDKSSLWTDELGNPKWETIRLVGRQTRVSVSAAFLHNFRISPCLHPKEGFLIR